MSEIRVENIIGETGTDAVTFSKGLSTTGIVTATNVSVGSSVTAATFHGSGAGLTGVSAGKVLQVLQTVKKDVYNADVGVGALSADIPGLSVTITPSNANNKILVSITVGLSFQDSTPKRLGATIYKGVSGGSPSVVSGAIADASGNIQRVTFADNIGTYNRMTTLSGSYLDTAGSTNATTYSIRISHGHDGTKSIFVNRASSSAESNHSYHMRSISTITAMEVEA